MLQRAVAVALLLALFVAGFAQDIEIRPSRTRETERPRYDGQMRVYNAVYISKSSQSRLRGTNLTDLLAFYRQLQDIAVQETGRFTPTVATASARMLAVRKLGIEDQVKLYKNPSEYEKMLANDRLLGLRDPDRTILTVLSITFDERSRSGSLRIGNVKPKAGERTLTVKVSASSQVIDCQGNTIGRPISVVVQKVIVLGKDFELDMSGKFLKIFRVSGGRVVDYSERNKPDPNSQLYELFHEVTQRVAEGLS